LNEYLDATNFAAAKGGLEEAALAYRNAP